MPQSSDLVDTRPMVTADHAINPTPNQTNKTIIRLKSFVEIIEIKMPLIMIDIDQFCCRALTYKVRVYPGKTNDTLLARRLVSRS